jgi:hypothetical protein
MTTADERGNPQPWERRREESPEAYQAFVTYRDLAKHSFVGAAKALGKSPSLLRRWARLYDWKDRVWAWDRAQTEADAVTIRQERDEAIRRSVRDADHLKKLAMGRFSRLVHRDPTTGELTLDDKVTPRIAVWLYKLALDIERSVGGEAEATESSAEAELGLTSDAELREVIALARQRAQEKEEAQPNDSQ